jgi:ribosome-associated protein
MDTASTSSWLPGVELGPGVWTDRTELRFGFSRSSGPGGQNVNKVNTKTELRIRVEAMHGLSDRAKARLREAARNRITLEGDLLIVSETERTQEGNRRNCMEKLRNLIVNSQKEPKIRRKSKPSKGSKVRRLDAKKKHGAKKKLRAEKF